MIQNQLKSNKPEFSEQESFYQQKQINKLKSMINSLKAVSPDAICQRTLLRNDLRLQQKKLKQQLDLRQIELGQIRKRLQTYREQVESKNKLLEQESILENEFQDFQNLQIQLTKQLRLLGEEEKVKRGKAIIEYNHCQQTKQEQCNEQKRKELLQKHCEEVKKGSQNLKKKVKFLKEQLKKRNSNKVKLDENQLNIQIKKIQNQLLEKQNKLTDMIQNRKNFIHRQELNENKKEYQKLLKDCLPFDQLFLKNVQLKQQRTVLQNRIDFLQNVDLQFINEKKVLLRQLHQKYDLMEAQKDTYEKSYKENSQKLEKLMEKYPQGIQPTKFNNKKKRVVKCKELKKDKVEPLHILNDEKLNQKYENRSKKWRIIPKLRAPCRYIIIPVIIIGLFLMSMKNIY